jgi:hypothetical protein
MVSVGMANGFQKSLATAAGDLSANAIQIALAGFGLRWLSKLALPAVGTCISDVCIVHRIKICSNKWNLKLMYQD